MEIIGMYLLLIPLLLAVTLYGIFLLIKQHYEESFALILSSTFLFLFLLIPTTIKVIDILGYMITLKDLFLCIFSVCGMILGIFILRKHFYSILLPMTMNVFFILIVLLLYVIGLLYDALNYWVLGVVFNELLYMDFTIWGVVCTLVLLILSTFITIFFGFRKKDLIQRIKYNRKYLKSYLYVAGLPSACFLFCWFQYSVLNLITVDHALGLFLYLFLLFACAILYFIIKCKAKTTSKFKRCIYIAVNILLATYLIKNMEYIGMTWLLSLNVTYFIAHTFYEVKNSEKGSIPDKSNQDNTLFTSINMGNTLLSYVPLFFMAISNFIIVACDRAFMF